jgi:MoaA/NifB/PqqE/SkfB family radical SAM enzyme
VSELTPRFINFHITNRCGNRCRHCRLWETPEPPTPPPGEFCRALDEVADWLGPVQIVVSGGEPLMHPTTFPLLAQGQLRGMQTFLATNGFLIDEAMARRLAELGLHAANVSLDGFAATHDFIRNRPRASEQAMRAIGWLVEAGVRACVTTVILQDNLDEIPALVDFLAHDGRIGGVFFQAMVEPFGGAAATDHWWRENPHFPRDTARVHALCDRLLAMKRAGAPILNEDGQFAAMKAYFANPARFTMARCPVGAIGLTINAAGDALLCNFMPPVGNITKGNVRDIYHSARAAQAREEMARCEVNCHLLLNCCFDEASLVTT